MDNKTHCIITPSTACGNVRITYNPEKNNAEIAIVQYEDASSYAITSKDGSVPDITLDATTVDLLIRAKEINAIMSDIIMYLTKSPIYRNDIINDKKVMETILATILTKTNAFPHTVESATRRCIDAQKYRI